MGSSLIHSTSLENEDTGDWTPMKLADFFPEVPIVLDFHHFLINDDGEELKESFERARQSWKGVTQLTHYSEGRSHRLDKAHSDYVSSVPQYDCDIEIEAKAKDLALLQIKSAKK
jgi:UV DNA damage repair endonuclease